MSDLVSFRICRAPQRVIPDSSSTVPVLRQVPYNLANVPAIQLLAGTLQNIVESNDYRQAANDFINDDDLFVGRTTKLADPILALDRWLADRGNRAAPDAILNALDFDPQAVVASEEWWVSRLRIGNSIIVAMLVPVSPEIRVRPDAI